MAAGHFRKYLRASSNRSSRAAWSRACAAMGRRLPPVQEPDQFTTGRILRLMEASLAPVPRSLEAGSSPTATVQGECRTLTLGGTERCHQ